MHEPMPQAELSNEVEAAINERLSRREVAPASWITQAVVAAHPGIAGDDAPFYVLCAYEHVRDTVREVLRKIKKDETEQDQQNTLPGFKHLQKRYLVTRDEDQVVVAIESMTHDEIEAKCAELETMATGCMAHARELRRYASDRFDGDATASV